MGNYLQGMFGNSSSSLRSTHLPAEYAFRRWKLSTSFCHHFHSYWFGSVYSLSCFPILNNTFRLFFFCFRLVCCPFYVFLNPYEALVEFRRQKVNHCVDKFRRYKGISVHHFTTRVLTSLHFIYCCAAAILRPTSFLAETFNIKERQIAILKWFYLCGFWVMTHDIRSPRHVIFFSSFKEVAFVNLQIVILAMNINIMRCDTV